MVEKIIIENEQIIRFIHNQNHGFSAKITLTEALTLTSLGGVTKAFDKKT